jgi:hypothetical protein
LSKAIIPTEAGSVPVTVNLGKSSGTQRIEWLDLPAADVIVTTVRAPGTKLTVTDLLPV